MQQSVSQTFTCLGQFKLLDIHRHIKNCNQLRSELLAQAPGTAPMELLAWHPLWIAWLFIRSLADVFSRTDNIMGRAHQWLDMGLTWFLPSWSNLLRKTTCPAQFRHLTSWPKTHQPQANHRGNQMNLLDADPSKQHISIFGTNIHQQLSCCVIFAHTQSDSEPSANVNAGSHGTFSKVFQPVNSWHHLCASSPASFTYTREAQALQRGAVCHRKLPWTKLYTAMCLTKPSSLQNALLSLSMQE